MWITGVPSLVCQVKITYAADTIGVAGHTRFGWKRSSALACADMAGVEEIRAGIAVATERAQAGIAAMTQASMQLDEARSALMTATQGTGQADMAQAHGMLAEALQTIAGAQATVQACISSAEGYAARL